MKRPFKSVIGTVALLVLMVILSPARTFAGSPEKGGLTVGAGASQSAEHLIIHVGMATQLGQDRFWQLSVDGLTPVLLGPSSYSTTVVGLSAGVQSRHRFLRGAVSVGPTLVRGYAWFDEDWTETRYLSIGARLQGHLVFTPIPEFGLGLEWLGMKDSRVHMASLRPIIFLQRTL